MSEQQTGRDRCYICGGGNSDILETHHIVPQRFDGDDSQDNLVDLCASCHRALEKLYDRRFYKELGVESENAEYDEHCTYEKCYATATRKVSGSDTFYACDTHHECDYTGCKHKPSTVLRVEGTERHVRVCKRHSKCSSAGCYSQDVMVKKYHDRGREKMKPYCAFHEPDGFGVEYTSPMEEADD